MWFLLPALALFATPADAAPLAGVVAAVSGVFGAIGSSAIGGFLLRTAASFALNALAGALMGKPKQQRPGISTDTTMAGGTLPQTVIFGRYATAGTAVCPPMTHGTNGDTVDYLTYVIDLADYPIDRVRAVFVGETKCGFTVPGGLYGNTAEANEYHKNAWLRWYDGRQTKADPMLVQVYGKYDRPWTENHVLVGTPYAVLTFKHRGEKTTGMPECLVEVDGARLYDPRRDAGVGGAGPQSYTDPATWEFTTNPVVMVYNLMLGLRLPDGSVYGLGVPADELPLDRWVAAMNTCDELVEVLGDIEPRYRAGLEFSIDQEPLDVIQALLTACSGQIADCGGAWNISVGPAPFPRAHFTDGDLIVGPGEEFQPYRGLAETYNGAHASYPNPDVKWKAKDAPPFYNSAWEEEDGRRLTATLNLNAVFSGYQAQRLMRELVADNRRWISHTITLRPGALGLLPLDTVSWTSAKHGYERKLFEIARKVVDPLTLCVTLQLRERAPADYEYDYDAVLQPVINPAGPWNPEAGDTTGAPDGTYPGLPVERPDPLAVRLLALHSNAVSESTDGAYSWTRAAAPFQGGAELSALRESMLVRTESGEGWYAARNAPNAWRALDFPDLEAADLLQNGDFEDGLAGWTVEQGSAQVVETTTPPQVGGLAYLRLNGAAQILQSVEIPEEGDLTLTGDLWVTDGESRIGVGRMVETASVGINGYLHLITTSGTYINLGGGLRLKTQIVDPGNGGVNSAYFLRAGNLYKKWWRVRASVVDVAGDVVPVQFSLNVEHLGGGERIALHGAEIVSLPTPTTITRVDLPDGGVQLTGNGTANSNPGANFTVWATGTLEMVPELLVTAGAHDDLFYQVHVTRCTLYGLQTLAASDEGKTGPTSGWKSLSVRVRNAAPGPALVFVEGTAGLTYADNLRLVLGKPGAAALRVLASDTHGRRHFAASDSTLYAVEGGAVRVVGPLPLSQPTALAAFGSTLVVGNAAGEFAVSADAGATWGAPLAAGGEVAQAFGRPALVGLEDGRALQGGGAQAQDLAGAYWLDKDAWAGGWFAVARRATTTDLRTLAGPLGAMTEAPAMPRGGAGTDARVVAADHGRKLVWRHLKRDLLWLDQGAPSWRLARPLVYSIQDLREVR